VRSVVNFFPITGEVGVAFGDVLDDEEVDGNDQVFYHFSWTGDNVATSKYLSIEIRQDDATGPVRLFLIFDSSPCVLCVVPEPEFFVVL